MDTANTEEKAPALPADILAQAAALDAAGALGEVHPGSSVTVQSPITPERVASDIEGLMVMGVEMLSPLYPKLRAVWTPEACKAVAMATAPVLIKHNWVPDLAKWGPEVMLCLTVAPLLRPTLDALKLKAEPAKPAATAAASTTEKPNEKAIFIKPASTEAAANGKG